MPQGCASDSPPASSPASSGPSPVGGAALNEAVAGAQYLPLLQEHLKRLRRLYDHPNRVLHLDTLLTALLVGFYESSVRSLRTLEDLSCREGAGELTGVRRTCRSTVSDAMRQMDAGQLLPIVEALAKQVPQLRRDDGDLHALMRRIVALDGSVFTVPADVMWAIALTRPDKKVGRQFRLNLRLDVLKFMPVGLSVSGRDDGSETAAFMADLAHDPAGIVYVADRGFVDFRFIHAVFDRGSDLVVRLKSDTKFVCVRECPLSAADRQAGVISDRVGHVPGSNSSPGFGDKLLREVIVVDPKTGKSVRLLTNLLDLPAQIIGLLYRHRWMIEIFFKWLKCTARLRHLMSESRNGILLQLYVAVIGVLLTHLRTGRRPSLYAANCLTWVASGQMSVEAMSQVLERRDRERDLERARRERQKAAASEKTAM